MTNGDWARFEGLEARVASLEELLGQREKERDAIHGQLHDVIRTMVMVTADRRESHFCPTCGYVFLWTVVPRH